MHKKALTVAIAGALAAPMAAQAVDFTISGHVNRALFLVDTDGGSKEARVQDNGGSSTRIRATGSTEMMDGNKVGIQLEYQHSDGSLGLRHANVQYSGGFGKMTLGQGSEAGDGSAYSDTTGVFGIGHGAGTSSDFSLGSYFGSLDGGGRVDMIRYDTPSLGPASVAVSLANGDRVSGRFKLSGDFGGTSLGAQLATLQESGDKSTIGASFGVTMASGLTLSGAWAKGKNHGAKDATEPALVFRSKSCHAEDVASKAGEPGSEKYSEAYKAEIGRLTDAGQSCTTRRYESEMTKTAGVCTSWTKTALGFPWSGHSSRSRSRRCPGPIRATSRQRSGTSSATPASR